MLDMNNVEHFKRIATELGELYEKKNKAYGNSFSDTYKKLGIISAVTRISDKYNRLCNLAKNPGIDNLDESIEDTLRDMAAYSIMAVMELENTKVIRKGEKFECIKDVVMDNDNLAYTKGAIYLSETNNCITDAQGNTQHLWVDGFGQRCEDWRNYFKRI